MFSEIGNHFSRGLVLSFQQDNKIKRLTIYAVFGRRVTPIFRFFDECIDLSGERTNLSGE
ncbi:hypothetical protein JCM18694_04320 [Prolixibacter denitrificans]|uniref:Uncharacterized protein n=1 Tax=Prolixibacter denitrificans TaxID=1541063 RepID=A0ABQ0ZFF2_9BACT|nr:hypothetical protein JCM18694_04320 [Prolixibacter denitrificans]